MKNQRRTNGIKPKIDQNISLASLDFETAIRAALATGTMPGTTKNKGVGAKSPMLKKPKRKAKK